MDQHSDPNSYEVNVLIRVKQMLEKIPEPEQSIEYKNIVQLIIDFLHVQCQHEIMMDYIDTSPDNSQPIFYCRRCLESFDNN